MTDGFPFRRVLTFAPLIEHWREVAARTGLQAEIAASVLRRVDDTPLLLSPIDDAAQLRGCADLVEVLLHPIFPQAGHGESYGAVLTPFGHECIHQTRAFERRGLLDQLLQQLAQADRQVHRAIVAWEYVLSGIYGTPFDVSIPFVATSVDATTGLDRYFGVLLDHRFCRPVAVGPVPTLSAEQMESLQDNRLDLDLWRRTLPPENFELHGLGVFHARDVTEQKVMASLTGELLQPDAMRSVERVLRLESHVRTLLNRPHVELGLICVERDGADAISAARAVGRSLLLSKGEMPYCCNAAESVYTRVIETRKPEVVRDLACCGISTEYEQHLRDQGMRNLLIAPLMVGDRLVGLIELASPVPGDVHILNAGPVHQVLGLFAAAMKRTYDDRETRVQAVIKQQYTAIHPSVEWRFRKAALKYMEAVAQDEMPTADAIVFKDVYPLYGLSDIRGSSSRRSEAIQQDLRRQLDLARDVVRAASMAKPLPVLTELDHRMDRCLADLANGLRAGDELRVLDFLRQDLEEIFQQLDDFGETTAAALRAYRAALDPELGFLYGERRAFEQAVALINDTISVYIDREQALAQAMFPHYFEKFKTNGVDYNIYVGASLQEERRFQPLYLRNLRIWQLMLMCGIIWELDRVGPRLPIPLETAHLILAQSTPLSIRFRVEEKQFDVDGAYNIRYEIVKKRIDKARVRGGREHLTQPGCIAIVYSHPREAAEYREYLDFLAAAGYLTGPIEELELEDLQGASGLQAMRVTVARAGATTTDARPIVERVNVLHRKLAVRGA